MPDVRDRSAVLYRANDLVAAWLAYRANRTPGQMAVVELRIEELLDLLLAEFRGEITREQANEVFSPNRNYLDPNILEMVPDPLVPIAVMREVMSTYKIMPSPARIPNWGIFWEAYGDYIQNAR